MKWGSGKKQVFLITNQGKVKEWPGKFDLRIGHEPCLSKKECTEEESELSQFSFTITGPEIEAQIFLRFSNS